MHRPSYNCRYLSPVIRTARLRKTLLKAARALRNHDFDSIAFRGMSGALIAPVLALHLNKTMLLVRKGRSHAFRKVEGDQAARRYIIVDDFIDSGNTIRTIHRRVKEFAPQAECIGVYLYDRGIRGKLQSIKEALETEIPY